MLPGILACKYRPGPNHFVIDRIPRPIIVKEWKLALDNLSQVIEKEKKEKEAALQEITIDKVGGNSEQVIEKEQISAADERDIIEAALQEITIDKNNVAKYIEKEHNSAQTYSFYK